MNLNSSSHCSPSRDTLSSYNSISLLSSSHSHSPSSHNSHSNSSSSSSDKNIKIPSWIHNYSVIRILLVFANPNGTHPLRLQAEEKCIREALLNGEYGDRVKIDVLAACTIDELARKLMASNYEIIHFSGHADRTATLLKHIVEVLQRDYNVDHSSLLQSSVKADLTAIAEQLVNELEIKLIKGSDQSYLNLPLQKHDTNNKINPLYEERTLFNSHDHLNSSNIQIPLNISNLPVKLRDSIEEGKQNEFTRLNITRNYTFQELLGIGVGSLAFESEAGGVNFMCPLSFAKLISESCPPLQCVILNACAGQVQAEILAKLIPLTVCFTGRVSDKESIMFSRGFYESIASGRALDDAFKDGSRRIEIHSLSNGMPNRNIPSVNKFCNLAPGLPLITLIRNHELSYKLINPPYENILTNLENNNNNYYHNKFDQSNILWRQRFEQLEKENQILSKENTELRGLIQYGMGLLKSKDQAVNELKETLGDILSTLKSNEKSKKNSHQLTIYSGLKNNSQEKNQGKKSLSKPNITTKKVKPNIIDKNPQIRKSLKYRHVKSSGYGKRAITPPKLAREKSDEITNKKAIVNSPNRPVPPSPTRIPVSQIRERKYEENNSNSNNNNNLKKEDKQSRKSISVIESDSINSSNLSPPQIPLPSTITSSPQSPNVMLTFGTSPSPSPPPPPSQLQSQSSLIPTSISTSNRQKQKSSMSNISQIPVPKYRTSNLIQSETNDKNSSNVVIKPTAWSKSYQNTDYDESNLININKLETESERRGSISQLKYPNHSSEGWREFLRERRETAARLKPSSSFASLVPRFDSNASSIE